MLKTKEQIKQWLASMDISQYTIHDDLTVDVDENVELESLDLYDIPIQFGVIDGFFSVNNNNLTSLKGCPTEVTKYFNCANNELTSLEYCPKEVGGSFTCRSNNIESLEHAPDVVGARFIIGLNPIKNLNGFKTKIGTVLEHGIEYKEQVIPQFDHLYETIQDNIYNYKLTLTVSQLESVLLHKQLNQNLPSKEDKPKQKSKV